MNGKISIDPERTKSIGEQITTLATEYNREINTIYSIVDDLKNVWTGTAAQRFTDNIKNFESDYKKFGVLLQQIGELLSTTGNEYSKLEDSL